MKRGGPLRRRTPLKASTGLTEASQSSLRRTPLRNRSKKQAERQEAWQVARHAALSLARFRCERCQSRDARLHVHHRLPRSAGGTDRLDNLAVLCEACHRHVHEHPAQSYAAGWLRSRYDQTL